MCVRWGGGGFEGAWVIRGKCLTHNYAKGPTRLFPLIIIRRPTSSPPLREECLGSTRDVSQPDQAAQGSQHEPPIPRAGRTAVPGSRPRPSTMLAGEDHSPSSRMMRCSTMAAPVSLAATSSFMCCERRKMK
jgi:hypothetical protein